MPSWICQWKPFWIPVGESFKKAHLEEWIFTGDDSSGEQRVANFPVLLHGTDNTDYIRDDHPPTPRPSRQPVSLSWEPTRHQDKAFFWERIVSPLPPLRPRCTFIHPRQLSPFPERLELPFSSDEIMSGYEDSVSSGTDQFTAWVKMDPHEVLVHHMVDVQKATADFREASSSLTNRASKHFSNRSTVQKRLSIYNWNPGPRRGKEDAFEKQIAGRWHVITLQEASEYVDHDILTSGFHVTHYAGCAIFFNKDTFYPNIDVKSIYLHDTRRDLPHQVLEGEQGWSCKVFFHVPHFVDHQPADRSRLQCCHYISTTFTPRRKASPRSSSSLFVLSWFLNTLTWLQVISMVLCGDAAAETTSVLLTKPLLTAPCQRHRVPHHCGVLDQFRTTGQTSVDFFNHQAPIDIGRCACMVHSPYHEELSACDQLIKVSSLRITSFVFRRLARHLGTARWTQSTHFPQRTSCVIASRATEQTHQWNHERPLALLVTVRPFAHAVQFFAIHVHSHEVTWWHSQLNSIAGTLLGSMPFTPWCLSRSFRVFIVHLTRHELLSKKKIWKFGIWQRVQQSPWQASFSRPMTMENEKSHDGDEATLATLAAVSRRELVLPARKLVHSCGRSNYVLVRILKRTCFQQGDFFFAVCMERQSYQLRKLCGPLMSVESPGMWLIATWPSGRTKDQKSENTPPELDMSGRKVPMQDTLMAIVRCSSCKNTGCQFSGACTLWGQIQRKLAQQRTAPQAERHTNCHWSPSWRSISASVSHWEHNWQKSEGYDDEDLVGETWPEESDGSSAADTQRDGTRARGPTYSVGPLHIRRIGSNRFWKLGRTLPIGLLWNLCKGCYQWDKRRSQFVSIRERAWSVLLLLHHTCSCQFYFIFWHFCVLCDSFSGLLAHILFFCSRSLKVSHSLVLTCARRVFFILLHCQPCFLTVTAIELVWGRQKHVHVVQFCVQDFLRRPSAGEWFSESKNRCPDFATRIFPPWVSGFSECKIRCPDFAPRPAGFIGAAEHGWQHPCFTMIDTVVADIICELSCTAVSIIFPRLTTLCNASSDVFVSSLHSILSLCYFVISVKLLSHLLFWISTRDILSRRQHVVQSPYVKNIDLWMTSTPFVMRTRRLRTHWFGFCPWLTIVFVHLDRLVFSWYRRLRKSNKLLKWHITFTRSKTFLSVWSDNVKKMYFNQCLQEKKI